MHLAILHLQQHASRPIHELIDRCAQAHITSLASLSTLAGFLPRPDSLPPGKPSNFNSSALPWRPRERRDQGAISRGSDTRPTRVLFLFDAHHPSELMQWAELFSSSGYHAVWTCSTPFTEKTQSWPADLKGSALLGMGITMGSRGPFQPLTSSSLASLRQGLIHHRQELSKTAGYPISLLCPMTSQNRSAFDGLVEDEARRAGFSLLLAPGSRPIDLAHIDPRRQVLPYRTVQRDDAPEELVQWILGKPAALLRSTLHHATQRLKGTLGIET